MPCSPELRYRGEVVGRINDEGFRMLIEDARGLLADPLWILDAELHLPGRGDEAKDFRRETEYRMVRFVQRQTSNPCLVTRGPHA